MRNLCTTLLMIFAVIISFQGNAQENKPLSPKETVTGKVGGANATIVYSRPSARGRKIVGSLVPYGEVWRTGANEATTITFDKAVKVEGKDLAAGTYALFTIPGENEWTIIFNKESQQWGAYKYKDSEDVLRVKVKPTKLDSAVETFTIATENDQVSLKWENTAVAFKVK